MKKETKWKLLGAIFGMMPLIVALLASSVLADANVTVNVTSPTTTTTTTTSTTTTTTTATTTTTTTPTTTTTTTLTPTITISPIPPNVLTAQANASGIISIGIIVVIGLGIFTAIMIFTGLLWKGIYQYWNLVMLVILAMFVFSILILLVV